MVRIISEVAKYLIIFFMVLYTVKCFTVLKPCSPAKKRRALNVQIFYVFIIHFLCYLTLYLNYKKKEIAIFYVAQMIVAIVYMVSYHGIYKNSSRLITNNMTFLLLIGFVMLTRIDFSLAKRQFIFATIALIVTAFIPKMVVNVKRLKYLNVFYAIFGIGLLATVFVPGLGISKYGARNWIGIGDFSFQPMELVKIIFVFFVASSLEKSCGFKDMVKTTVVAFMFVLVLVAEKDLGGAVIFCMIYLMMLYVATQRLSILICGGGFGALAATGGYLLFKVTLPQE